jgi:hypothetical protein
MRIKLIGLLAALLLAIPAFAQQAAREGAPRNISLFGWDGAQRAHVATPGTIGNNDADFARGRDTGETGATWAAMSSVYLIEGKV